MFNLLLLYSLIILQSTEKLLDLSDTKKHADLGISNELVSFCYMTTFSFVVVVIEFFSY